MEGSRFRPLPCRGSYFQLMDYSAITREPDAEFAMRLTKEHGVASIPTSPFLYRSPAPPVLRFCFAKKDETLERAAERLRRCVDSTQGSIRNMTPTGLVRRGAFVACRDSRPSPSPSQRPGRAHDGRRSPRLAFRSVGPSLTTGRISDIAIDPKNPNVWYVAASAGNLWKTENRGNTFTPIFDETARTRSAP